MMRASLPANLPWINVLMIVARMAMSNAPPRRIVQTIPGRGRVSTIPEIFSVTT